MEVTNRWKTVVAILAGEERAEVTCFAKSSVAGVRGHAMISIAKAG